MLQSLAMVRERRRYTTVDGNRDWVVTVEWDDTAVDHAHWFESRISVRDEKSGETMVLPRELSTYRIGEIEHSVRDIIRLDWDGDRDAALSHFRHTIFRRIYSFIERGH